MLNQLLFRSGVFSGVCSDANTRLRMGCGCGCGSVRQLHESGRTLICHLSEWSTVIHSSSP
jgi:hypothetical protein